MDGPKLRVLSAGGPSNTHLEVGSIGEGKEVGGGWPCLEDRLAQDTFIFGTTLGNGWILPSSSFPEQPWCQSRPKEL